MIEISTNLLLNRISCVDTFSLLPITQMRKTMKSFICYNLLETKLFKNNKRIE